MTSYLSAFVINGLQTGMQLIACCSSETYSLLFNSVHCWIEL